MANKQVLAEIKARKKFENEVYEQTALRLARLAGAALAVSMKDLDYTKEQTQELWGRFNNSFESLNNGEANIDELEAALMDEYSVQIQRSNSIKIK